MVLNCSRTGSDWARTSVGMKGRARYHPQRRQSYILVDGPQFLLCLGLLKYNAIEVPE